jgi:hypothetical protein
VRLHAAITHELQRCVNVGLGSACRFAVLLQTWFFS